MDFTLLSNFAIVTGIYKKDKNMFAITKRSPQKGVWQEDVAELAPVGPNDVKVKVTHVGICGTDFHIYKWNDWAKQRIKPPLTIGHEFVGEIVEVGDQIERFKVGMRVSAECHIVCKVCKFCRTGRAHICQDTEIIGVDRDGAFAEYVTVPATNIWPVHEDIPDHHAAIFDPFGNAMHAVMSEPIAGKSVLVTGAGAIGLMSIAIARSFGARHITVLEPLGYKRNLAKTLGADIVVDPTTPEGLEIAKNAEPAEILLEMSGSEKAIHTGLDLLENGGTAVMMGIPGKPIQLDLGEHFIFRGLNMKGVIGRKMYENWYQVEDFMRTNPEAVETCITNILPKEDFQKGFEMMEEGSCAKIVLKF
jgi:threonine 3-dehydrogenase